MATVKGPVKQKGTSNPNEPDYFIGLGNGVFDGSAAGISLTLNSWNYVSNEFSCIRQQTKFDMVALNISTDPGTEPEVDARIVGLVTRRAA